MAATLCSLYILLLLYIWRNVRNVNCFTSFNGVKLPRIIAACYPPSNASFILFHIFGKRFIISGAYNGKDVPLQIPYAKLCLKMWRQYGNNILFVILMSLVDLVNVHDFSLHIALWTGNLISSCPIVPHRCCMMINIMYLQ